MGIDGGPVVTTAAGEVTGARMQRRASAQVQAHVQAHVQTQAQAQAPKPARMATALQLAAAAATLALQVALPAAALAQQRTGGQSVNLPQAWEIETAQAGGKAAGDFRFVGALRCRNTGEAIVGARLLRSEVVDAIQIGCAPLKCDEAGDCRWEQLERGVGAGNANADARSSVAVCPRDQAVSGFRARIRIVGPGSVDYVEDLQLECARVIGPPLGYGAKGPQAAVPISDEQRAWMRFPDETGNADGRPWPLEQRCDGRAATAISLAVGIYRPTGQPVVQALSMFCARAPKSAGAAPP